MRWAELQKNVKGSIKMSDLYEYIHRTISKDRVAVADYILGGSISKIEDYRYHLGIIRGMDRLFICWSNIKILI